MQQRGALRFHVRLLLVLTGILTMIGLVFIYSASSVFAAEKFSRSSYFLIKQSLFLLPSFCGFFIFASMPVAFWKRRAPLLFGGALALMALTLVPSLGVKVHGARRWLYFAGMSAQPSEFLKLFLFLYLGFFLDRKQTKVTSLLEGYVPFLAILGVAALFLFKQPDFGTIVTIFITAFMLFFVAQFRLLHLLVTGAVAMPLAGFAIYFATYRLRRILIFLNPWSDPQGKGYQIIQSLIAIGSGSIWGVGIANSRQKFFYLPMQHTDFIFSIIAEETGFIGCVIILLLYALFCYVGIKIAAQLTSPLAFYTTLGFILLISLQVAINLMVVSGMVPTKGLSLPFISYGGSALVANYCMLGLIVNFARNQRRTQND